MTPWLYQVARNTAFTHARLQAAYRAGLEEHGEVDCAEVDQEGFALEEAEHVHDALQKLSLPHREVLTLFFLEDMTVAQIAEVIDSVPGTVKSRLYYARQAVRKILAEEKARE